MKKIIALLCALLLLTVSCASAEGTIVEFQDKLLLNGALPADFSYSQISLDESTLLGNLTSDDPAGVSYEICISLSGSIPVPSSVTRKRIRSESGSRPPLIRICSGASGPAAPWLRLFSTSG